MKLSLKAKEYTKRFHPDDRKCCKIESACACSGLLFFLPLVSAPDSKFGKFWANQGLIMLIIELILLVIGFLISWLFGLLSLIPFIGIIFTVIKLILFIAIGLLALFLIVLQGSFAARGRAVDMPLVGHFRFIK